MGFNFKKKNLYTQATFKSSRLLKRSLNPYYPEKAVHFDVSLQRSIFNIIYNRISLSLFDLFNKDNSKKFTIKASKRLGVITKNKLPKDSFQFEKTVTFNNKKWSFLPSVIAAVIGYLAYKYIGAAILLSLVALITIIHNKKDRNETKDVYIQLHGYQIDSLIRYMTMITFDVNKKMHTISNSTELRNFFPAFTSVRSDIKDIEKLMIYYHIPSSYSNIKEILKNLDEREAEDLSDFIKRYYSYEEKSASELKTERGYKDRLLRKKDELLRYSDYMSKNHLDLIDELWSSSRFYK